MSSPMIYVFGGEELKGYMNVVPFETECVTEFHPYSGEYLTKPEKNFDQVDLAAILFNHYQLKFRGNIVTSELTVDSREDLLMVVSDLLMYIEPVLSLALRRPISIAEFRCDFGQGKEVTIEYDEFITQVDFTDKQTQKLWLYG